MKIKHLYSLAVWLFCFLFYPIAAQSPRPSDGQKYIKTYKELAIREMKRSGIPASIIVGQGMIETHNGKSSLVSTANNHFGIKCHNWNGEKVYFDDDAKGECFRKYQDAEQSFADHSDFLMKTKRYSFLFKLDPSDYIGWAQGLKQAGYATDPLYSQHLIKVIEDNQLYLLDQEVLAQGNFKPAKKASSEFAENFVVGLSRQVLKNNQIEYVVAKKGDNLHKIADEMQMLDWELRRYNDLPKDTQIYEGQVIYIQPKRRKAEEGKDFYTVANGQTMHSISQMFGVKLRVLYRKNRMKPGSQPVVGQQIWLRTKKSK